MATTTEGPAARRRVRGGMKAVPAKSVKKSATAIGGGGPVQPAHASAYKVSVGTTRGVHIVMYHPSRGVDDFVHQVSIATPLQLVETERKGVAGRFLKDIAKRMEIPAARVFTMVGVPKATAEKKAAAGEVVSGSGGQAAIGIARLLGIAQAIVSNSTAAQAKGFDSAKWFGQWLERPQPSLGGRMPADLLDTPTGIAVVARLLGAIESGSYQ